MNQLKTMAFLICLFCAGCGGGSGEDGGTADDVVAGDGGSGVGQPGGTLVEQVAAIRASYVSDGGILISREEEITRILDEGGYWGAVVGVGSDLAFLEDGRWTEWGFVDRFSGTPQWISTGTVNGYHAAEVNLGAFNGLDEDVPGMVIIISEDYWIHITGDSFDPSVTEYAPGGGC